MQTTRRKAKREGMLPTKEWLNTEHAAEYLEVSRSKFATLTHNFRISKVGKTRVYSVASLRKFIEQNEIVNSVSL